MASLLGNDVSSYQGTIDFDTYKNNANFVILKASEGVGFTDPQFVHNQSEARRVGLPLGYYHFARPDLGNDPSHEADWFCHVVGTPREGEIFALDFEVSYIDPVGWCLRFLERMRFNLNGCKPLIYLNQSQVKSFNWKPVVDADSGLWIAAYTGSPNNNTYEHGAWTTAAMQQWISDQTVPGISSPADGNVFFGDVATFKKYGFHAPVVPIPQPPVPEPPHPPPAPPMMDYTKYMILIKEAINKPAPWWYGIVTDSRFDEIKKIIVDSGI